MIVIMVVVIICPVHVLCDNTLIHNYDLQSGKLYVLIQGEMGAVRIGNYQQL